ncbi:CGNR zinc finger domain-containing protein [Mycolicibacterium boenickei]
MPDPRPHVGEPLALDLLNTRWISADGPQDLLTDVAGLQTWLLANDLEQCEADEKSRAALVSAREAILRAVQSGATAEVNEVLDHGRIRRLLTEAGPAEAVEVPRPEWRAGWLAVADLLRLLGEAPDRIKQCAHPHCVLWFYDTSKNGARRWHSMSTCGNRAKAARHYAAKRD